MLISNIFQIAISLALEIWLVTLLIRRAVRHHFKTFFVFMICAPLSTSARLLTVSHYGAYFYTFWCSEALLSALSLVALHEVFRWVFEGFHRRWQFRVAYFGTIAITLVTAAEYAIVNPPVQAYPLIGLILDIGLAINLLQVGIVGLFYALTRILSIEFRRYAFGIVAGFGVIAAGTLLLHWVRSEFGTRFGAFAQYCSSLSYILGLAFWIAAFIRPEPEDRAWTPPMTPDQMLQLAHGYLKVLGISKEKK